MSAQATQLSRREELRRRVEALPKEIAAWKDRAQNELDMNAHFSQVQAIGLLMSGSIEKQTAMLNGLKADGDGETFRAQALDLIAEIITAQKIWDFFRDKLDLRFSPTFKSPLWIADTVAWDCYRPVLEAASVMGLLPKSQFREPPLTYLTAEFSPATWVRGSRPNDGREYDLGTSTLPVPVIELPWDHVTNTWEFLSLHHEVGHDLEADFNLRASLQLSLQTVLSAAGVPAKRINIWQAWQGEVFADLVGLQLAGPAFGEALMNLLLLPSQMVTAYDAQDPHPSHYPRILMNAAYMRTLAPGRAEINLDADDLEARWKAFYGEQHQFDELTGDFPHVFKALMDSPMAVLKGKTIRELIPFGVKEDARIRAASQYLLSGMDAPAKGSIRPRHCVSAARLAVKAAVAAGGQLDASLEKINERTTALVRDNAAPGLRAGDGSKAHRQFISSFVPKL